MILMLYTKARGGIKAVVDGYILDGICAQWNIEPIPSHLEGTAFAKAKTFFSALWIVFLRLITGKVTAAHCHVATRGSMWRKIVFLKLIGCFGVPVIFHLHGAETKDFFQQQPLWRRRIISSAFTSAMCVITLSESWKEFVLSVAPKADVRVIPNYVVIPEKPATRHREKKIVALFLGEIGNRKGVYDLLAAMKIAVSRNPNLYLRLGGNGEVEKARNFASNLGITNNVEFLGWVSGDKKNTALREADIYVLPSYFEGLPVSIIEAMSMELPILSTTAGAIPEMIGHMQHGILVNPGDIETLASALSLLADDIHLRQRLGSAARRRALAHYSKEAVVPMLNQLYSYLSDSVIVTSSKAPNQTKRS